MAYKGLGYTSWDKFADKELEVSKRHYYRLLEAARVERNVGHICPTTTGKPLILPITYALELGKLPTPELQAKAYDEAVQAAPTMKYRGEKESRFNGRMRLPLIKGIVTRMLGGNVEPMPDKPKKDTPPKQERSSRSSSSTAAKTPDKPTSSEAAVDKGESKTISPDPPKQEVKTQEKPAEPQRPEKHRLLAPATHDCILRGN